MYSSISLFNFFSSFLSDEKQKKLKLIASQRTNHITIALEDFYQSHNISAALRTAECFGVQNVQVIAQKHFPKIDDAIAKGASAWIDTHFYQDNRACINFLKENNYKIVATALSDDAISLDQLPLDHKCAIFFGTERQGLSKTVLDQADYKIKIPMFGFTESFNVSASAAIILYDLIMRLHQSSIVWQLSQEEQLQLMIEWMRRMIPGSGQLEKQFLAMQK